MRRYLPLLAAVGVLVIARPGRLAELPAAPAPVIAVTVGTAAAAGAGACVSLIAARTLLCLPALWLRAALWHRSQPHG